MRQFHNLTDCRLPNHTTSDAPKSQVSVESCAKTITEVLKSVNDCLEHTRNIVTNFTQAIQSRSNRGIAKTDCHRDAKESHSIILLANC